MPTARVQPQIEVESATASDILDGLESIKTEAVISGHGVIVNPPGVNGPEEFLSWALLDVTNARQSNSEKERRRHCVSAVLHARRGFACLVDWFLERDLASLCKNPPRNAKQKVEFLISRGIIDELTSHVVERAIRERNKAEHQYQSPSLEAAENVVELFRRIADALRLRPNAPHGPWIFGNFRHSAGIGKNGIYGNFHGWMDSLAVFSRFGIQPWIGLVLPKTKVRAIVRRVFLRQTSTDQLVQLLALARRKFGIPSSYSSAEICELLAQDAGLLAV